VGRKTIVGVLGLLVGFVAGAAATWGLDPAEEPEQGSHAGSGATGFVLFVDQGASDADVAAIESDLQGDPRIEKLDYLDHEESLVEYRDIFADNDAMLDRIDENPDLLPTSFRFTMPTTDDTVVGDVLTELGQTDGVQTVIATLEYQATIDADGEIRWD
jgi:cell division protein FtsX